MVSFDEEELPPIFPPPRREEPRPSTSTSREDETESLSDRDRAAILEAELEGYRRGPASLNVTT